MTVIPISASNDGAYDADALAAARQAVLRDGFVVLEDVVDLAHVEVLRERTLDDLQRLLARKDRPSNWVSGNLQQNPPYVPPFLFRDVLVNEHAIAVTSAVLGGRVKNGYYSGNTALPSEQRQPVHSDIGHLFTGLPEAHPPFQLVVNVPLVDVSAENGSTEIWPGSHHDQAISIHDGEIEISQAKLDARRAVSPPIQPSVRAGSIVIRDIRLWHAGMPNHTPNPRPMLAMIHSAWWYGAAGELTFPHGTEPLLEHPVLTTVARFVDREIDHISSSNAYKYEDAATGASAR